MIVTLWQCQSGGQQNQQESEENKDQPVQSQSSKSFKKRGKSIAKASGRALIGRLQQAIAEGGISHAVQFCSKKAMPLTDSLSQAHDAVIHRVSHKNRNPANEADSFEKSLIDRYKQKLSQGAKPQPTLVRRDDQSVYYQPIKLKSSLCLNCHGKKGDMLKIETFQLLRERYPEGEAIGFEVGDLRGLWKIQFKES